MTQLDASPTIDLDPPADAGLPDLDTPWTLNVDGEDKETTLGAIVATAQKAGAVDNRLREASEKLAAAEKKLKDYGTDLGIVADLRQAGDNNDLDAMRRAAVGLGHPEADVDAQLAAIREIQAAQAGGAPPVVGTPTKVPNAAGASQVSPPQIDPAAVAGALAQAGLDKDTITGFRAFLGEAQRRGMDPAELGAVLSDSVRAQGKRELGQKLREKVLDTPGLKPYTTVDSQTDALVGLAEAFLTRRMVQTRAREVTPDLIQASVQEARTILEKAGASAVQPAAVGLGPTPDALGFSDTYTEKPLKRPPSTEGDGYDNFIGQKLMRRFAEKSREPG